MDVADGAILKDIEFASDQGLLNIHFQTFDGVTLPFDDHLFDAIFCRYAFHHLPLPSTTLKEIHRTLQKSGKFIFSDAVRSKVDTTDFINKFQDLKQDGHVRMATIGDLLKILRQHEFVLKDSFLSSISFDRDYNRSYGKLIDATDEKTLQAYGLSLEKNLIRLSLEIFNGLFEPSA